MKHQFYILLLISGMAHAECDRNTALMGGRRLSIPIFRLRADFSGASATQSSILFPSALRNMPLQIVESRFRFEFNNLSTTDSQTVSLCARAGMEIRMHSREIEGLVGGPIRYNAPTPLLTNLVLSPTNAREVASSSGAPQSSASIIVSYYCDLTGARQCFASVALPGGSSNPIPGSIATVSSDPVFQSRAALDTQLVFFLPIDIVISEDRGAVSGSLATLINRTGGYNSSSQGAIHYLPINNGRPF